MQLNPCNLISTKLTQNRLIVITYQTFWFHSWHTTEKHTTLWCTHFFGKITLKSFFLWLLAWLFYVWSRHQSVCWLRRIWSDNKDCSECIPYVLFFILFYHRHVHYIFFSFFYWIKGIFLATKNKLQLNILNFSKRYLAFHVLCSALHFDYNQNNASMNSIMVFQTQKLHFSSFKI